MPTYHLAQINIARMLAPIDDPIMGEFVAQLPPINALEAVMHMMDGRLCD